MINVLVVDDSAVVRSMLCQLLNDDGRFFVAGTADNGAKAVEKNNELSPDLIVLDLNMPIMGGIEAAEKIMQKSFPAIVAFTTEHSKEIFYRSLEVGIVEVVEKPDLATMSKNALDTLCQKFFLIAESQKKRKFALRQRKLKTEIFAEEKSEEEISDSLLQKKYSVLAVGASTGGPVAIQKILSGLSKNIRVPILITQHIDPQFDSQFARWLSDSTGKKVELARHGEILKNETVYVAPSGSHLCLARKSKSEVSVVLDKGEPVCFFKPAVDKMFFSCAEIFARECIALILTGMGRDGAQGCRRIKDSGGLVVAEAEETCAVFGMPKAAVDAGGVTCVKPIQKIPQYINSIFGGEEFCP
jgi:two-component system chemotaxis response regulator CheB